MSVIKISLFQKDLSKGLSPSAMARLSSLKTDFLLLPEYFYADSQTTSLSDLAGRQELALDWLSRQNKAYGRVTIAGSVLRKEGDSVRISAPILSEGEVVDWYDKQKLNTAEKKLAQAGEESSALILGGQRFSVLLGDEIYDKALTQKLEDEAVQLVFCLSMVHPKKIDHSEKEMEADEARLVEIARRHNLHIVRCSPVGSFLGKPLKGRSVVVNPKGVSWRISAQEEDNELLKTVVLSLRTL